MARPEFNGSRDSTDTIGFEAKLWLAADKLRNNMDAAEYNRAERDRLPQAARRVGAEAPINHVVLGLIFLKYISDTFEEHRAKLLADQGDYAGANAEDPDEPSGANRVERDSLHEVQPARAGAAAHGKQPAAGSPKGQRGGAEQYKAENGFWVPADARWSHLQASAKQPTIGKTVDDAMVAIERDNPRLKGVLPTDYARPSLDTARRDSALFPRAATPQSLSAAKDNQRLGELIDVIATIELTAASEGEKTHRSVELLGRVYDWSGATKTAAGSPQGERGGAHQYFLTRFASAEGKNGGQPSGARQTAKGSPQGERGGVHQFYTPSCVVRCLVEMLAPYKGRIYDPACGSGGSLPASRLCGVRFAEKDRAIAQGVVQSEKFVESHGGKLGDISIYGQDKWARRQRPFGLAKRARRVRLRRQQPKQSNATTRRLAIMNLAIRGIEADIGKEHADTFRNVQHPDLRADYVLANPPFNDSDWFRKDDDVRWQPSGARSTAKGSPQGERGGVHQFGVPPKGNANFAWVQHFIHHLAPQGMAGFVLANGSMSSNQSGDCPRGAHSTTRSTNSQSLGRQRDIRRALIEADLVDCMVALPGQLFYSTQIPVCLLFLAKNKNADAKRGFRDRRKHTLFIDARKLGTLIDRVHRELTDADLEKITSTYHAWRGDSSLVVRASARSGSAKDGLKPELQTYADIPGFCKSATTAEIAAHGHVPTPGRYVGAEEVEDDGDPFEEKLPRLVAELHAQFAPLMLTASRCRNGQLNPTPVRHFKYGFSYC